MNIKERKYNLVREIISINDDELINRIENIVYFDRDIINQDNFKPMTESELNLRISESEIDYQKGRIIEAESLSKEIDEWNWKYFGQIQQKVTLK